ncbi:hypothetical protein R7036_24090, partial [Vibrio sp. 1637]|uniref:hypothetical protein n=1 Tax=Vibrio sp. 1637 TaxID=3074569 RepID=UPI0029648FDE
IMRFEGPNSHPYTRKTGNADFLGAWMRQAQRVSSVANVCSEHLLLHHAVTSYPYQIHSASLPVCSLRIAKSGETLRKFRGRSRPR